MAQTVANLANVLKEVWTASELSKQFYAQYPLLDRLEKTDRYTIGDHASVPLQTSRAGATTTLGSAGGALNPASNQKVNKGTYTLTYNWAEISLEFGALNQAVGGATSVVEAKLLEVQGAIDDMRKDVTRQAFFNGDAVIATVDGATATTINGRTGTTALAQAVIRGFLRVDQKVSIATSGASDTNKTTQQITALSSTDNSGAGSVTFANSVTCANDDILYIAGARSGNTAAKINDMLGLRSIAGSSTTKPGGLDPTTETYWKPAQVDTTTTAMTIDLPLSLQQNVFQQTGMFPREFVTGIKQLTNLYKLLQNQVRFSSDSTSVGAAQRVTFNGNTIDAYPDCLDNEFYVVDYDSMLICTGSYSAPTWASDVEGAGGRLRWNQGNTNFVDGLVYALGLAIRRRNSFAAATGLTA